MTQSQVAVPPKMVGPTGLEPMTSTVDCGNFDEEHLATVTPLIPQPSTSDVDELKTAIVTTLQVRAS